MLDVGMRKNAGSSNTAKIIIHRQFKELVTAEMNGENVLDTGIIEKQN